jgi:putative ABC transport system permease protein
MSGSGAGPCSRHTCWHSWTADSRATTRVSATSDLGYAVRMLRKQPGVAAIAILALGLGIGLTTTMWSIVYGVMLRGLPVEGGERIVAIERTNPLRQIRSSNVAILDYDAWAASQTTFEGLGAFTTGPVNLSGVGRPERYRGASISPNILRLMRVRPHLGRSFSDEEGTSGGPQALILGYDAWRTRFGADSSVIGRTLRANGTSARVVGVMPKGFQFPELEELWLPLQVDRLRQDRGWGASQVAVVGRLKPGVTIAQAVADLQAVDDRLGREFPQTNAGYRPVIEHYVDHVIGPEPRTMLWTMFAAVVGVLLIACANVANLLLARAASRTREVAVRTALGAGRWRIVSQLLTEALVLSAAGALVGVGIAAVGVRWFNDAIRGRAEAPYFVDIRVDPPVLLFVTAITLVAGLVAGALPAVQATGSRISEVLKDESRGSSSLRLGRFARGLVITEIALACGLLVGAGFMILSVVRRSRLDYGVPTQAVFTARVGTFETAAFPDSASRQRFFAELVRRVEGLPGQHGVALASTLPGMGAGTSRFELEGTTYASDREHPAARLVFVSPGYFPAFRLRALEGRVLDGGDVGGALPALVVTRRFATRHFPGTSALGRRVRLDRGGNSPWLTIVGVVPDVWYQGTDDETPEAMFVPILQRDVRFLALAVAADGGDPLRFTAAVRGAVAELSPDQPVYDVRPLQKAIDDDGWYFSVFGALFTAFGIAALFLATIGVYGVMSFAVTRRTQEVGVRMALGADGRRVMTMFLRQGAIQVGIGLVLGLGLAFELAQGLKIVLFQVNTRDPVVFAAVILVLVATGLAATLIPARRAARVDPMIALRYD